MGPWIKLPYSDATDHGYAVGWYRECLTEIAAGVRVPLRWVTWKNPFDLENHDQPDRMR
jgi:hypothetical protein